MGGGALPDRGGAAPYPGRAALGRRSGRVRVGDRNPIGARPLPVAVAVPVPAVARRGLWTGRYRHVRLLAMTTTAPPAAPPRSVLRNEVLLVLGVSLGASALMSVLRIAERLTRDRKSTRLNSSHVKIS